MKGLFSKRVPGVPIHRAVRHVAGCIGEVDGVHAGEGRLPRARAAIRQAAGDGVLSIRGRKQLLEGWSGTVFSDAVRKIPREYWETHELTEVTVSDDPDGRASVSTALTPALRRSVGNNYGDLEVDWAEVEKLWPGPGAGSASQLQ